jgi:ribosomal protein L31
MICTCRVTTWILFADMSRTSHPAFFGRMKMAGVRRGLVDTFDD